MSVVAKSKLLGLLVLGVLLAGLLPGAAPALAASPASTTGGTIVFQTSSGGAIYAMNADGTNLHYLTNGIDPALSPNARQVAFTRWDGSQNGATGSLWVINVDGTGLRQVLSGVNQPKSPTWSADGTQIVINMQQGGTLYNTWMCFVNGKAENNLPQPVPGAPCIIQAADPHWALSLVNVATGTSQNLTGDFHSFAPTWDPAQPWEVAYAGGRGLQAVDITRSNTWNLTTDPSDRSPVFSPNGSRIAVSYWQNDHWEIHVMNADGTGDVRLTQTPDTAIADALVAGQTPPKWNNAAPAWSPDGSQIAFLTDRTGSWEIWVMNADGSNQHPLVTSAALGGLAIQYYGMDERVISWR